MKDIAWILINCNTVKEADDIGKILLRKRLISCFDILPRLKTSYFWPPKSGKIESGKGAMLVTESLKNKFINIKKEVMKVHSDKLPFIGAFNIKVDKEYFNWVKGEIK